MNGNHYCYYDRSDKLLAELNVELYGSKYVSLLDGIYGIVTETEAKYYRAEDHQLIFETGIYQEPDEN